MKQLTILCILVVVVALAAGLAAGDKLNEILVTLGGGDDARGMMHYDLDDYMTVRQLGEKTLDKWDLEPDMTGVRMESNFGRAYNLDHTLREAGIKDKTRIKLKAWSRLRDALFVLSGARKDAQVLVNEIPEALNGKKAIYTDAYNAAVDPSKRI